MWARFHCIVHSTISMSFLPYSRVTSDVHPSAGAPEITQSPLTEISLDSREKSVKFGTHSAIASDLGERLFFATDGDNARLQIKDVQTSDGGVYRCRVDFFESATRNSRINLTLVGKCTLFLLQLVDVVLC